MHLQDPRQYTIIAEVVGRHTDEDERIAIVVSSIVLDDEEDWFHGRLHGVWLNEHIVARDIDGAAIDPLDIPVGSMISVRGFPHMLRDHGASEYYDFEFSIFNTRVIEVTNIFEVHLRDTRQCSFVGEVVGFHTGRYSDSILVRFMFSEEGIAVVWLNPHVVARDASGTAINSTGIPIGSVVSVRGFPPHSFVGGEPYEEFDFHIDDKRMIEILNPHEVHWRDLFQSTITGEVVGFYFGHADGWFSDEYYENAIIIEIRYDDWLHGIWLSKHVIAIDADGVPINPLDIPIGTVINVRGFGHSETSRSANQDYFKLSVFHTRLIEVVD